MTYSPSYQKKTVKRSAQCHVFAQSPPGRRPNQKYPVNTSHRSDLCKNFSLQCYLVTTSIHIQSLCCQICVYVYTYCAQYRDGGGANEIIILGQRWMQRAKEIFLCVILDRRATGWSTLVYTLYRMSHSESRISGAILLLTTYLMKCMRPNLPLLASNNSNVSNHLKYLLL